MSKRELTPEDPRLAQLIDMRERGLNQSEMARALGISQQTVSRLLRYIDTLAAGELTRVKQRKPNPLSEMMRRTDERRVILDEIEREYNANGESEEWSRLWVKANAL